MPGDDSPDIGLANAGAFKFIHPVQVLKHTKEFVGVGHIKAHPVIPNKDDGLYKGWFLQIFSLVPGSLVHLRNFAFIYNLPRNLINSL
jgi:hypothetical protein